MQKTFGWMGVLALLLTGSNVLGARGEAGQEQAMAMEAGAQTDPERDQVPADEASASIGQVGGMAPCAFAIMVGCL